MQTLRPGNALQPRRDVDAIAKNVVVIDDDVADVNAMRNSTRRPAHIRILGTRRAGPRGRCAPRPRAGNTTRCRRRCLDDASAMCGDGRIDKRFSNGSAGRACLLVDTMRRLYRRRLRQNRRQAPFHLLYRHSSSEGATQFGAIKACRSASARAFVRYGSQANGPGSDARRAAISPTPLPQSAALLRSSRKNAAPGASMAGHNRGRKYKMFSHVMIGANDLEKAKVFTTRYWARSMCRPGGSTATGFLADQDRHLLGDHADQRRAACHANGGTTALLRVRPSRPMRFTPPASLMAARPARTRRDPRRHRDQTLYRLFARPRRQQDLRVAPGAVSGPRSQAIGRKAGLLGRSEPRALIY